MYFHCLQCIFIYFFIGKLYGENYSKSPEFNSWGAPVLLRVEVPLVPVEGNFSFLSMTKYVM